MCFLLGSHRCADIVRGRLLVRLHMHAPTRTCMHVHALTQAHPRSFQPRSSLARCARSWIGNPGRGATVGLVSVPAVVQLDPSLAPFVSALEERYNAFAAVKTELERHEGGLLAFSEGYRTHGLIRLPNGDVRYREWIPGAAQAFLMGEFSTATHSTGGQRARVVLT